MGIRLLPYPGLIERYIEACATNDAKLVQYLLTSYRLPDYAIRVGLKNAAILGNDDVINVYYAGRESVTFPIEEYLDSIAVITTRTN